MNETNETMLFSEAMMLGRHLIKPVRGIVFTPDRKSGCAIGMAWKAVGLGYGCLGITSDRWPYLRCMVNLPCDCSPPGFPSSPLTMAIAHIFDDHVMEKRPPKWTLEQLADFVRQYEPKEKPAQPEPEQVQQQQKELQEELQEQLV